jgi:hypothetical protein
MKIYLIYFGKDFVGVFKNKKKAYKYAEQVDNNVGYIGYVRIKETGTMDSGVK